LKVKVLIGEVPPMSAAFVVDCSIAMAWLYDETTPKTAVLLNRFIADLSNPRNGERQRRL
jgi:hypothetical protein